MQGLQQKQLWNIDGGFINFMIGAVVGSTTYAVKQVFAKDFITYPGITTAATVGGITGGLSGSAISAAGGGLAANIAWRPGFIAINAAGQKIAANLD